ncbi:unnamed protein product [Rotaria sp. Silwood1]|nr:unnamed protein product [Rotaria sp. Silwood1]
MILVMFHVELLIVCLLVRIIFCQEFDVTICPNGLTSSSSGPHWQSSIPKRFEFFAEVSTDAKSVQITQLFHSPKRDAIIFHNFELITQKYYDFQTNEILSIDKNMECTRLEIDKNEGQPIAISQIVKPSILLGFNERNEYNNRFYTRYVGSTTVRGGIAVQQFQSCFYVSEQNLTINATYFLKLSNSNVASDIVQIDVLSKNFSSTYNIIRFISNSTLDITTPSGVFCPNRTITKKIPENFPSRLSLHAEALVPVLNTTSTTIESYDRLIDQVLEFERIDYIGTKNNSLPSSATRMLIDYSVGLSYTYERETQQCTVMNMSVNTHMHTMSQIVFQFGTDNNVIKFQYTGIHECDRDRLQCHRWIGQNEQVNFIQQYEWFWSAKYNQIDLQKFIPIKVNINNINKHDQSKVHQEFNFFNYNSLPNSMQAIDSTLAECYRALGPSHGFNYAILRMTLNNDAKHPVERHLLSLQYRLHLQLAVDLGIRHIRLSSIIIDTIRNSTDNQSKDVYVTFTLLDNPPISKTRLKEPSSLELIKTLALQINRGDFRVRDDDGGYELKARSNSLRTLVLYLLPHENHTAVLNSNITQTMVKRRTVIVEKHTGSFIAALAIGFALLGIVIAFAIGSYWAVRKWAPTIQQRTS